jgi:uncharacterized repeat protein (TIGR01451 family)
VVVNLPASLPPGAITNVAAVSSPTPDPNPARRIASAQTNVIRKADITVVKSLATDPIIAGQPVTYDLTITNAGPSDALEATISDAIPVGTSLVAGSIGGGPPCVATDFDNVPNVSCVAPSVAVNGTVTGTLTLATTAAITGNLRNTAVAGAQALDSFDAGNTSTAEALVQQIPPDTTTTTSTTTAPPPTDASTTTTVAPGATSTTSTTTTVASAPPSTARRGSGGGGGSLPATGAAIGVLLLLAGGFVLFGTSLRTAVVDRSRRRRRR